MWMHRCVPRPLLGTSTFAAVWSIDVFNDIPVSLDIFGLWHVSAVALLIAAMIACGMMLLVRRHDRSPWI